MPRKAFVKDLNDAIEKSSCFKSITNLSAGDDDGEFKFVFDDASHSEISVLVPELSDYPESHIYLIFASDSASPAIAEALKGYSNASYPGQRINELLVQLPKYLVEQTRTGESLADAIEIDDSDVDDEMEDVFNDQSPEDDSDDEEVMNEDWLEQDDYAAISFQSMDGARDQGSDAMMQQARADLLAAKEAGFKVGVLGRGGHRALNGSCYVVLSIRIGNLKGLSDEVLTAWSLPDKNEYLQLLLYYPSGYKTLEALQSAGNAHARQQLLKIATRIGSSYKPVSIEDAQLAFSATESDAQKFSKTKTSSTRKTFISGSLDELLNGMLLTLVEYRLRFGFNWTGASDYYRRNTGLTGTASNNYAYEASYQVQQVEAAKANLKNATNLEKDELAMGKTTPSLPLIAMQFMLRHFVGCTKFCLVCFEPLKTDHLEAMKPYVCERGLCLYQMLALGLGPSLEHEILKQPFVVDLLISFAYTAVKKHMLPKTMFPTGLALNVPHPGAKFGGYDGSPVQDYNRYGNAAPINKVITPAPAQTPCDVKIDPHKSELLFSSSGSNPCCLRRGDWIVVNLAHGTGEESAHYRVMETSLFPSVRLSAPVFTHSSTMLKNSPTPLRDAKFGTGWLNCNFHKYEYNFDDLKTDADKFRIILLLLDLMPSVMEMKKHIEQTSTLSGWDRLSPAGLGVLRWIVASCRSSIISVDNPSLPLEGDAAAVLPSTNEPRVPGLDGWVQFRFASGNPDKEARFLEAIKQETASHETYKTLFAWHGSDLGNWHSILRLGLHYEKTTNGRAFGNGIYHAKDFATSNGYSARGGNAWPSSALLISTAVALSEIVNRSDKFVSSTPYYVVQHTDWVQTRYLFVQPAPGSRLSLVSDDAGTTSSSVVLPQDAAKTPLNPKHQPLVLPITAVPKSRRPNNGKYAKAMDVDDDFETCSIATLDEDYVVLQEPPEPESVIPATPSKRKLLDENVMPFQPAELKHLPLTTPPAYASSMTTRRLQKDFMSLLAVQEEHITAGTLSDLGWYVSPDQFGETGNLYQWICELHSFSLGLPLAKEMVKAKVNSVVMELRFHNTYPMSPPFVRVIRPRFLPFANGGGGHVTLGGSLCMDMLTNSGWSAVSTIEAVLMQIRMAISSTDPRPARLDPAYERTKADYSTGEAVEAFKRACRTHGWEVPKELNEMVADR